MGSKLPNEAPSGQRLRRSGRRLQLIGRPEPPAAYPGQLPALGHELTCRIPDLGLLVKPAAADVTAARSDKQRPGHRNRAHVPGQLHRGSPAGGAEAEYHRRQCVDRERQQQRVGITVVAQPDVAAHFGSPGRLVAAPARDGRIQQPSRWAAKPETPFAPSVPGHLPRSTQCAMSGNCGASPVQLSDSPSAAAPLPAAAGPPGSVPVVTVMSTTCTPSCTRAARAIDAVRPVFSQVTSTSAGPSCGTRRKLALVATG